jgi:biotin synthase
MKKTEAISLATSTPLDQLCQQAAAIRRANFGDSVQLCVIENIRSGRCPMDCRFCSQSAHNPTEVDAYPLWDAPKLQSKMASAAAPGIDRLGLVTSGLSVADEELARIAQSIEKFKATGTKLSLCASFGQLNEAQLQALRDAGLTRYHHNLETSESFYPQICTTQSWSDRRATVERALRVGLEVCCGGLFGLGESWSDRIDLAITLRELGVKNIPLNFFTPHPKTPLGNRPLLDADEALRIIAVYRIMLPEATLRVCGGRPSVLGDREPEIFAAGANGIMTGDYLTSTGRSIESDRKMIAAAGMKIE